MNKLTMDDLQKQRASLTAEVGKLNNLINQTYGALRLVDHLIAKEQGTAEPVVPPAPAPGAA